MKSKTDLVRSMLRWSLIFLIIGLVMGVYSRELLRPAEKALDPVSLELASQRIFLGHGHFIFLGCLIPFALALILKLFTDGMDEKRLVRFSRWWTTSRIGIVAVLALSTYKSSALVLTWAANPGWDLHQVEGSLYMGSVMLRSLLYTAAHTTMGVGVIVLAVILLKQLKSSGD